MTHSNMSFHTSKHSHFRLQEWGLIFLGVKRSIHVEYLASKGLDSLETRNTLAEAIFICLQHGIWLTEIHNMIWYWCVCVTKVKLVKNKAFKIIYTVGLFSELYDIHNPPPMFYTLDTYKTFLFRASNRSLDEGILRSISYKLSIHH